MSISEYSPVSLFVRVPISSTRASLLSTVLQMMPVPVAGLEAGAIARLQDFFAGIGDQHHFAGQHIDEFVLLEVPMALAGPRARRQPQQIDAELGEAGGVAQLAALARPAGLVDRAADKACR